MIRTHLLHPTSTETRSGLELSKPEQCLTWVEVTAPTPAELDAVGQAMGLRTVSLSDALRPGHPPKAEVREDHLFTVVHTPALQGGLSTDKIALFMGLDWIVTLVAEASESTSAVFQHVREAWDGGGETSASIAHRILLGLNEAFESQVVSIAGAIEVIEERIQQRPDVEVISTIGGLRAQLNQIQILLREQRSVFENLAHTEHPVFASDKRSYFRDAYDNILRVEQQVVLAREEIHVARDLHHAMQNQRMNETMRVLTVIATIMMPLSLIAGFYGMNVPLPGMEAGNSVWVIAALMFAICVGMLIWFRRRRWV